MRLVWRHHGVLPINPHGIPLLTVMYRNLQGLIANNVGNAVVNERIVIVSSHHNRYDGFAESNL